VLAERNRGARAIDQLEVIEVDQCSGEFARRPGAAADALERPKLRKTLR
jgi:hypothetical protein